MKAILISTFGVLSLVVSFVPTTYAAGLEGQIRQTYISSSNKACFEAATKAGALKNVSKDMLEVYCMCGSRYVADRTTNKEVIEAEQPGGQKVIDKIRSLSLESAPICGKKSKE